MYFDILFLIAFIFQILIFLLLGYLLIKKKEMKMLFFIFIVGFYFYSGLGLALHIVEYKYLINLGMSIFSIIFLFFAIYYSYKTNSKFSLSSKIKVLDYKLIYFMMLIHLFTYLFPLLYPNFNLFSIFDFANLVQNYKVLPFATRVFRSNDFLYVLVTVQLRLVSLPFFFIWLYIKRGNPYIFVSMFLLPFYLQTISNFYISRNEVAVIFVFLTVYFYIEKVIHRRLLFAIIVIAIPTTIIVFSQLYFTRVSLEHDYNTIESIFVMFRQETAFVLNYSTIIRYNSDVNILQFLLYIFTLPLPFDIMGFFGMQTPNLAQILTFRITGLTYGDSNYFLLLPSVYGEGIMIFNLYFGWLYAFVLAPISFIILRFLARNKLTTYLMIWFLIDYMRQMRGGSQYILAHWINMLVPFILILLLVEALKKTNILIKG